MTLSSSGLDLEGANPAADLLDQHLGWLRRLARSLVGGDDGEDLAQDTLRVALESQPDPSRPLRPWLAGVARNLARMRHRSEARRRLREDRAFDLGAPPDDPETLTARTASLQRLVEAVGTLDEALRAVVVLRYYEGCNSSEIASRLGIAPGTARWRLSRALESLREHMDQEQPRSEPHWSLVLLPASLTPPARATAPTLLKGLIMKTTAKIILGCALLLALVWLGIEYYPWSRSAETTARPTLSAGAVSVAPHALQLHDGPGGMALGARVLADEVGSLRLEGQVIDEQHAGIGGAVVAIDSQPPRATITEADGSFHFDGLMARSFALEAHAGDLYAGPTTALLAADSDPIILRARPGGSVHVEVAGPQGPIEQARVTLRSSLLWQGVSDAQGQVRLTGVGTGWRVLRVEADGFAPALQMVESAALGDRYVMVHLQPGVTVAGVVHDDQGKPVAGARVWSTDNAEPFPVVDPALDSVLTDAQGRFELARHTAGTYRVHAAHARYAQTSSAPTWIEGDAAVSDIELVLEPGGIVTGTVRTVDGKPLAHARVIVAGDNIVRSSIAETQAGADGRFRIAGLPRRNLSILAVSADAASGAAPLDLTTEAEAEVDLLADLTGVITGRVLDPAGEPIAEAHVTATPMLSDPLWKHRSQPRVLSAADGRFRLAGLPGGRYALRAAVPDAPAASHLGRASEAHTGQDVTLVAGHQVTVRGRLRHADGQSPSVYRIQVDKDWPRPFAREDFSIALPPGRYALTIDGPGLVAKVLPDVEVPEDGIDLGTITVEKGRSLSGRVVDGSGAPVAGAQVVAGRWLTGSGKKLFIDSESIHARESTTDENGQFFFSGFDDAPIQIMAEKPEIGRSQTLRIPRSRDSSQALLMLAPTGRLVGKARIAGEPLSEIVILATPKTANGTAFFVMSDADGAFAFDALSPDRYWLQAMIGPGGNKPKDIHLRAATVSAGQITEQNIDVDKGPGELAATVVTSAGTAVGLAHIAVLPGAVQAASIEEIREKFQGDGGMLATRTSIGGSASIVRDLPAGTYTVCATPVPADPDDLGQMMAMKQRLETLPTLCQSLAVTGKHQLEIVVPEDWARTE